MSWAEVQNIAHCPSENLHKLQEILASTLLPGKLHGMFSIVFVR
jgi:hypothetical protein